LNEDWQFCFFLDGIVAPVKEALVFENLIIRGTPPSHGACVYFKASVKTDNEEEIEKLEKSLMNALRDIALIYTLTANTAVNLLPGRSKSRIDSEHQFGDKRLCMRLGMIPVFDEDRRKKDIPILEKTLKKYEEVKASIFRQKKKRFLKNAMDYYSRSLGDDLLEEKLVDLMIALESLFSKETQELRLRISQRASFFLCVGQENTQPEIFKDIYNLYGKRSKVVHGTEDVKLERTEIKRLENYVRDSIERFIHIEMTKAGILDVLDGAVYDIEKKKQINRLVEEAIKKW
jgi:hypothetical protein